MKTRKRRGFERIWEVSVCGFIVVQYRTVVCVPWQGMQKERIDREGKRGNHHRRVFAAVFFLSVSPPGSGAWDSPSIQSCSHALVSYYFLVVYTHSVFFCSPVRGGGARQGLALYTRSALPDPPFPHPNTTPTTLSMEKHKRPPASTAPRRRDPSASAPKARTRDEKNTGACGIYLRGMKREELVEPIPGRPCFTGLCGVRSINGESRGRVWDESM